VFCIVIVIVVVTGD